ncbi:ankyrin repeat domain-containing protein [Endozoicomonas euniceicola]|uniref:Ankyrin repeat domain-containing protein n=1 Tax=Endozoicomonas euniceicola TaxID=1234143 RepID=A0ABY6GXZ3_9GAMM|nr:ankyrin repeat domain-containing protein [Endozoicomonas euniceicola]UYM17259.1 ankyrin repeat domain-containing protein [Endozoicomonas euniceicola]
MDIAISKLRVICFFLTTSLWFCTAVADVKDNVKLIEISAEYDSNSTANRNNYSILEQIMFPAQKLYKERNYAEYSKNKISRIKAVLEAGADINYQENGYYLYSPSALLKSSDFISNTALGLHDLTKNFVYYHLANMNNKEMYRENTPAEPVIGEMGYYALPLFHDPKGVSGNTALIFSVREGLPDVVKLLLDKKANANLVNKNSFSALDYAIKFMNMYKSELKNPKNFYDKKINRIYFQRFQDIACMLKPITKVSIYKDIELNCNSAD